VLVKASVGQYLAGDKGGTLDISKHFDSGVVVGGYATITNVAGRVRGRGLHQRGLRVDSAGSVLRPNPQPRGMGWTPLTRDGGQQLGRKFQLYDMTSDKNINFR
jgi:hypothetical protein